LPEWTVTLDGRTDIPFRPQSQTICSSSAVSHPSTFTIGPAASTLSCTRAGSLRKVQMIHVITLYSVRPDAVGSFVRSIGRDGECFALSRVVGPALLASDLLQHEPSAAAPFLSASSVLFVCIDFWISREAYQRACLNPAFQSLILARRQMAASVFEFGAFSVPKRVDAEISGMSVEVWN
jgi:hypothetical protein